MRASKFFWGLMAMEMLLVASNGSQLVGQTANPSPALSLTAKLPADINPDTLSRASRVKREDFATDAEKAAFDRTYVLSPKQTVSKWLGPTGTRLLIPELAETYNTQLKLFHSKGTLGDRYYELVVAVALRETNNREEWLNHHVNREKLLGPKIEEILRKNLSTNGLDEKDAAIIQYGRELFREPKVSSKTFATMEKLFGKKDTLVASLTMCYYDANGLLMRAYDQHMDTTPGCEGYHIGCLNAKNIDNAW
jgi:4-carboxymuconolactone decarboxylase